MLILGRTLVPSLDESCLALVSYVLNINKLGNELIILINPWFCISVKSCK